MKLTYYKYFVKHKCDRIFRGHVVLLFYSISINFINISLKKDQNRFRNNKIRINQIRGDENISISIFCQ